MRRTTKKNLKELIRRLPDYEILQELIYQRADDDDVEAIVSDIKEDLDKVFNNLLNNLEAH